MTADTQRWTDPVDVLHRIARKEWRCAGDGRAEPVHAPNCLGVIAAGERHIEYVGEVPAYQSGSHHSMQCAAWFGYVERGEVEDVPF